MNCLNKLAKGCQTLKLVTISLMLLLGAVSHSLQAANNNQALVLEPRLSYLNTNNGLDQDTINDLYVDSEGFMWIATDEGLNRFDGAKVLKIRGLNNELESLTIYSIFEHSSGLLYLGTDNVGVLTLNKVTQEVKTAFAKPYANAPDWLEYSVGFLEDADGNMIFALDQSIQSHDVQSKATKEIFSLSRAEFEAGVFIRSTFIVKNKLFVGTNFGLTVIDLGTNKTYSIYGNNSLNKNAFNTKFLASFNGKDLFVGTVEGLYKYSIGELLNYIEFNWDLSKPETILESRNIWDVATSSGNIAYVGTDIGLYQLNLTTLEYQYLFKPVRGYEVLSSIEVKNVEFDRNKNVWFGTSKNGAMLWSPKSLSFTNIYNAVYSNQNKGLSDNIVWSIYQYDPNTLYVGTNNGLNKFDLTTEEVEQYNVRDSTRLAYSESEIDFITSTERGYLWLNTNDGVRYFSMAEKTFVRPPFASQEVIDLLAEFAFSVFFEGKERIWLLGVDSIFLIDRASEQVTTIDLTETDLNISNIHAFLNKDDETNSLLIASVSELWGLNLDDLSIKLLHSIKQEKAKSTISPTQFKRGQDNVAWIVYAGFGMYKLNGNTLATIESYSTKNILPTNLIYGLSMDAAGILWFSSHSGIHAFDPVMQSTKSFGFLNGLATSEFNIDSNERLTDGRLAYGGNLGFTMFQPSKLISTYSSEASQPVITEIHLISRNLVLPLTSLNNTTLELEHDDVGLSIYFSAVGYDQYSNNRFNYRIKSSGEMINYPSVEGNKLMLGALSSGQHIIEIYPLSEIGQERVARLYVNVSYPLFSSPYAYFIYALILIIVITTIYSRRRKVLKIVDNANMQVKLYNKRLTEALLASNSNIWEWRSENNLMCSERIKKELTENEISDCLSFNEYVDKIHDSDRATYLNSWRTFLNKEESNFDVSYRIFAANGKLLWYRDIGSLNEIEGGVIEVKGTYTNITQSMAAQDKLKLFGNAFKHTRDWVLIFNKDKRLIAANPSFMKAFGMSENSILDDNNHKLIFEQKANLKSTISRLNLMKPGERFQTESHLEVQGKEMTLLTDIKAVTEDAFPDRIDFYLIIATDITEQINAQKELQKLANYDFLTGLINRTLLAERLKQSIHFSHRHNSLLAAVFIDLDGFKPINDIIGHLAGDKVLSEIAARISRKFSEQDSVARVGGDEFVVILEEVHDIQEVSLIVSHLLKSIRKPIFIGKQKLIVTASIGIAMYPDDAKDAEHLIRNADIAMISAKEQGKNRIQNYKQTMDVKVQNNTALQNRVKAAYVNKEFVNFYQAVVDIESGENAGFEMLMRWVDDGTIGKPDEFIPVAEHVGCIIDMTMSAIYQAIQDISLWYADGFSGYVAINLSTRLFSKRPDFEKIIEQLQQYKLPTSCLRFEITEDLLIANNDNTLEYMHEMRKLGFKIALDDFGTGYSSLKYIRDFPLDVLKIDRSFIQDMLVDKGTESIVQSTLIMTELLGLDTVAEGVETQAELRYFKRNNCRYVQGFYFAKPMPADQIKGILFTNWMKNETWTHTDDNAGSSFDANTRNRAREKDNDVNSLASSNDPKST